MAWNEHVSDSPESVVASHAKLATATSVGPDVPFSLNLCPFRVNLQREAKKLVFP